ncbi:RNA polymerase sigma-I factor [Cohnella yongneupensis]|uniref:RNA polymerase sigma factor SigI n=1 Tax=Cohnella yongneupensis TaxID=425006 RepID=A0ABW0QWG6_9BACL
MLLVLWKKWFNASVMSAREPSDVQSPEAIVERIRNGETALRNELIVRYHPYIIKITSRFYRRYIDPQRDDAFSIALSAFDEAITRFEPENGRLFLGFAETVIRRRLIDYVRQESRHNGVVPYSAFDEESGEAPMNRIEVSQAMDAYERTRTSDERKLEIEALTEELAIYGITFSDLVRLSPSHQDSREALLRLGSALSRDAGLVRYLKEKRQLPIKELCLAESVSRKTIERHRKYVIAVSLIASGTYPYLQHYIGLYESRKEEAQ